MSLVFVTDPKVKEQIGPGRATVQKLLDENSQLIKTIVEYQNVGRVQEAVVLQETLHRNLVYLAQLSDSSIPLLNELKEVQEASNATSSGQHSSAQNKENVNVEPKQESQPQQSSNDESQKRQQQSNQNSFPPVSGANQTPTGAVQQNGTPTDHTISGNPTPSVSAPYSAPHSDASGVTQPSYSQAPSGQTAPNPPQTVPPQQSQPPSALQQQLQQPTQQSQQQVNFVTYSTEQQHQQAPNPVYTQQQYSQQIYHSQQQNQYFAQQRMPGQYPIQTAPQPVVYNPQAQGTGYPTQVPQGYPGPGGYPQGYQGNPGIMQAQTYQIQPPSSTTNTSST